MTLSQSDLLYAAACFACASIGGAYDVKSRRIPNLLTGPGIILGLILHAFLGGWRQLASSAIAGLLCAALFFVFHIAGGMGAGDVKLITAAGCFAGLMHVGALLFFTALAGGLMAIVLATYRGRLRQTVLNVAELVSHHWKRGLEHHPDLNVLNSEKLRLPYGVAIAAGSAVMLLLVVGLG